MPPRGTERMEDREDGSGGDRSEDFVAVVVLTWQ